MDTDKQEGQIAQKTAQGIFWNYASFGLGKGLVLVTTALLARILSPGDFGLVALATIAVNTIYLLKDLGLGAALIQRRQDVEEAADTVFTLNLLLGVLFTVLAMAAAPLAAAYFRQPQVTPLLRVLGFNFVLNALGSVHIVRLQRELAFRRKLGPDMSRALVKGVVSIGCALAGLGAWSLVIGQLAGTVAGNAVAWLVFPWRPRLVVHRRLARALLGFGVSLVGVDVLSTIEDNLDYLIIGRMMGETALGIYFIAYRLLEVLVLNTFWVMAGSLFPAYAAVQDRPEVLRRGYLMTVRYLEILVAPLCLGVIVAADPLVRVAFGEQWLGAIPVARVLALALLLRSVGRNVGDIYKAVGRADILIKLSVFYLAVLAPSLWLGAQRGGIVGVAWGHAAAGLIVTIARVAIATHFIRVSLWEILRELRPAALGGVVLVALAWPVLVATAELSALPRLILVMAAGGAGYLGSLWLWERDSLAEAGRLLGLQKRLPRWWATMGVTSSGGKG